jgi:hypothetical protein
MNYHSLEKLINLYKSKFMNFQQKILSLLVLQWFLRNNEEFILEFDKNHKLLYQLRVVPKEIQNIVNVPLDLNNRGNYPVLKLKQIIKKRGLYKNIMGFIKLKKNCYSFSEKLITSQFRVQIKCKYNGEYDGYFIIFHKKD